VRPCHALIESKTDFFEEGTTPTYPPSAGYRSSRVIAKARDAYRWLMQQLPNLDPKDLLPVGITVVTGALVLGNPSTPSILVAEFQSANGTFGVVAVSVLFIELWQGIDGVSAYSLGRNLICTSSF